MYTVTNGTLQQQFSYLTDANNFLNSNHSYWLLDTSEPRWEVSQIKTIKFEDVENLTILHNSGSGCSVSVYDESGQNIDCFSEEIDKNTVYIQWDSGPMTGKVVISAGFS